MTHRFGARRAISPGLAHRTDDGHRKSSWLRSIETFFQGHEEPGYAFVSQFLRDMFPDLIDLDRFNARRRGLIAVIEAIRQDLRDQKLDRTDPVRLVDSAPVALMTYSRGVRCKSV